MNDKWMTVENINKALQHHKKEPPDCENCPYNHNDPENSFKEFYCNYIKTYIKLE